MTDRVTRLERENKNLEQDRRTAREREFQFQFAEQDRSSRESRAQFVGAGDDPFASGPIGEFAGMPMPSDYGASR